MSTLLVWKDQIEKIYARYSFYIVKILQFVLGLCVFGLINSNIGFMKALSSTVCTVGLAAVTAFLPVGMLALVAALLVLVHLYALSLPVAGLCLAIFLVMYIFYVRFTPKKSWLARSAFICSFDDAGDDCLLYAPHSKADGIGISERRGKRTSGWNHGIYKTDTGQQRDVDDGSCSAPGDDGSIWGENKRHQSCVEDSFRCGSNRGGSASGVRLYDIGCFLPGKFYFTGSCGDSSSRSDSRIFLPFCGLFKNRDITV